MKPRFPGLLMQFNYIALFFYNANLIMPFNLGDFLLKVIYNTICTKLILFIYLYSQALCLLCDGNVDCIKEDT